MKIMLCSAVVAASMSFASAASAQTATNNLNTTMTITAGCTVSSGTVNFGTQSTLGANVDQSGTFNVTCTNSTPYTIGLDQGANGPSVAARRLRGGTGNSEYINYALYTSAARSTIWGVTTGTDTVAGTGSGGSQTITVYGRVPAQSVGSPGAYTDTVTITVAY